ncbi:MULTISPECIES: tRNA-uridine aminocarboxypropyltransferase [Colwellia]|uniref:tRNA-uridine aminocarboxypropyltransferase n=1 Tax=Colwellia marinimaniae TaxID=1513592 RepID=A0ABQ0MWR5_9GAMM|nr:MULTISPECIES: tRNA-uridine aminocarboxypropyltransferase [Colwellia]GAW96804.1 DTW domain-containing protein [Colwellia marinimaniae]
MKIFLLTHERELHRATNTGVLALDDANEIVERILWQRVNPNKDLVRLIDNNEAVLLYSKAESSSAVSPVKIEEYDNIIIIDSTWQEAKKIFNHSAYLKNAPQFTLKTVNNSLYKLRANQPKGGLCTIECIIEVLRLKGLNKMAAELSIKFEQFNG